jgi:hypothetical protein
LTDYFSPTFSFPASPLGHRDRIGAIILLDSESERISTARKSRP